MNVERGLWPKRELTFDSWSVYADYDGEIIERVRVIKYKTVTIEGVKHVVEDYCNMWLPGEDLETSIPFEELPDVVAAKIAQLLDLAVRQDNEN